MAGESDDAAATAVGIGKALGQALLGYSDWSNKLTNQQQAENASLSANRQFAALVTQKRLNGETLDHPDKIIEDLYKSGGGYEMDLDAATKFKDNLKKTVYSGVQTLAVNALQTQQEEAKIAAQGSANKVLNEIDEGFLSMEPALNMIDHIDETLAQSPIAKIDREKMVQKIKGDAYARYAQVMTRTFPRQALELIDSEGFKKNVTPSKYAELQKYARSENKKRTINSKITRDLASQVLKGDFHDKAEFMNVVGEKGQIQDAIKMSDLWDKYTDIRGMNMEDLTDILDDPRVNEDTKAIVKQRIVGMRENLGKDPLQWAANNNSVDIRPIDFNAPDLSSRLTERADATKNVGDFYQIEPKSLFTLAEQKELSDIFTSGTDIEKLNVVKALAGQDFYGKNVSLARLDKSIAPGMTALVFNTRNNPNNTQLANDILATRGEKYNAQDLQETREYFADKLRSFFPDDAKMVLNMSDTAARVELYRNGGKVPKDHWFGFGGSDLKMTELLGGDTLEQNKNIDTKTVITDQHVKNLIKKGEFFNDETLSTGGATHYKAFDGEGLQDVTPDTMNKLGHFVSVGNNKYKVLLASNDGYQQYVSTPDGKPAVFDMNKLKNIYIDRFSNLEAHESDIHKTHFVQRDAETQPNEDDDFSRYLASDDEEGFKYALNADDVADAKAKRAEKRFLDALPEEGKKPNWREDE